MRSIKKHDSSHQIQACSSAEEALILLKSRSNNLTSWPELIFLDIELPGMGGYEFLKKYLDLFSQNKEKTIICILTTSSHPKDLEGFLKLGIHEYLSKPLSPGKFTEIYNKYFM